MEMLLATIIPVVYRTFRNYCNLLKEQHDGCSKHRSDKLLMVRV